MKQLSRPISSPCRADKYPPQLMMRFLRTNAASRSRGRSSRSSPMFVRKKNAAIETQEPSSPKVTCMGQVRAKQSTPPGAPTRCCSKWITNALFCHSFHGKLKAKLRFFGSCRKPKASEDLSKFEGNDEDEDGDEAKIFASSYCSSPPKNALILTRCRSAPYRSSSLASRFWESPLPLTYHQTNEETELENRVFKDEVNPTSEKESVFRVSDHGSRINSETEENPGFCHEFEERKSENNQGLKTEQLGNVRPFILTRCKSEPARTATRLDPEISFLKKRTLGLT